MRDKNEQAPPTGVELSKALLGRYSCRAYLDLSVPTDVLNAVFELAQRAPTSGNTQPAKVYVLQGLAKKQFAATLLPNQQQGPSWYARDLPESVEMNQSSKLKARRIEVAKGLEASALGSTIDKRQQQAARDKRFQANYSFFGAPVGLIITIPKIAGTNGLVDSGIYLDYLCHAAQSYGLATCIQGAWWDIRDQVAHQLNIDQTKEDIVVGVSLGYPDPNAAINRYRSPRASISEIVTHVTRVNTRAPSTFAPIDKQIEVLRALDTGCNWGISSKTWDRATEISTRLSDYVSSLSFKKISPPHLPHQWGTLKATRWVLTPYLADAATTLSTLASHIPNASIASIATDIKYTAGSEVAPGLYWELIDLQPSQVRPNAPSVHRWAKEAFPHAGILSAAIVHNNWRASLGQETASVWLPGIQARSSTNQDFSDTPYLTTVHGVTHLRFENEGYCTPKISIPHLLARVRC